MKYAIIASIMIHTGILAPFINSWMPENPDKLDKPVVVEYVKIKAPQDRAITAETPRVDVTKKVEVKPAESAPADKPDEKAPEKISSDDAKKEAHIKSTKDYINYYQLIREKIRKRLKSNYRSYFKEGEVALIFSLTSEGKLISASINKSISTDDSTLQDIALASLKEASPFTSFPDAISVPQMSFELTVTFKRR